MSLPKHTDKSSGVRETGQRSIWSLQQFKLRQYGLVVVGLLILAGGVLIFASGGTSSCTQTLSPGASVTSAVNGASPGTVICLNAGSYGTGSFTHGGNASAPVTLTSTDPKNPATLAGRTVTEGGASYLNINNLKFVYTAQSDPITVVLGTPHVNFTYNDVSGAHITQCINGVSYGGSTVSYNLIDHNLVHDCQGSTITTQGIYMLGGPGDVISNNWCWNADARCYQIRGENGGIWRNNVSDSSGSGYIYGDLTPVNNNVYNNIVGSVVRDSAYAYSAVGGGNSFHDNCISKPFGSNSNNVVALANNTVVQVQFVDAANHNYNLSSASVNDPCRSYGVQGGNPGPGGGSSGGTPPPPPPPPPDTTPPTVSVSAPAAGATVSSVTTISASASDNVGVTSVQFKLDGSDLGSPDTTSPYSYTWNTANVSNGSHVLTAVASDAAGNTATATSRTVNVNNAVASGSNHYEYVFNDGSSGSGTVASVSVYDIDNGFNQVSSFNIPGTSRGIRGANFDPASHKLYISYGGDNSGSSNGSVLAYDLVNKQVVWNNNLNVGIDSPALSRDGKVLYQPSGELTNNGDWNIEDTSNGSITSTIHTSSCGPHNTIISADGSTVLLGGRNCNKLGVYNTATKSVTYTGPLQNGVRPATIDATNTFAFTTASSFDGFQVSNIKTGQVLFTTQFASFPGGFPFTTASHGISLSPDGSEVYVIDAVNHAAQVYNVSGVGNGIAPRHVATVSVTGLSGNESPCIYDCGRDGWVRHTLDGKYVLVGDSGDIINTATHQVVKNIGTLANSRKYIEIDWKNGTPVSTSSRYGIGYSSTQTSDTTPPTTPTSLVASAPGSKQVNLSWNASSDNVGVTSYRVYRSGTATALATVTAPATSFQDTSVVANTTYSYQVAALDAAGNQSPESASASVTTPPTSDTTPPAVSLTAPSSGATVSGMVSIAANASDNVGVSKVEFYINGTLLASDSTSPYTTAWNASAVANGSYALQAKAYDTAGNLGSSSITTVTVHNTDTTPPTAPTGLSAHAASPTQVNLSWTASTDNVGVAKYYVERQGVVVATVTGTTYSDTTVTPSTTYSYSVVAVDAAGNASSASSPATATTPATSDTTPPPPPNGVTATAPSPNQVNLNWAASSDPSGIKGYNVFRGGVKLNSAPITSTSYGDVTVQASTTYNYTVTAIDGANNQSASSNSATVTTPSTVVGGTFGKRTVGQYADLFAENRKRVNGYTLEQSMTVNKLNVYLQPTSVSGQQVLKGVIYADSDGRPGALIAVSSQLTFYHTNSAGWYALPLGKSLTLPSGKIWIGVITGDNDHVAGFRYRALSGSRVWNSNTYTSGPTSIFGSFTTDNERMSLYASNN